MSTLLLLLLADLFQNPPDPAPNPEKDHRSTRMDLTLNADFQPRPRVTGTASFEMPLDGGFAWFGFDPERDFRKIITEEIRDPLTEHFVNQLSDAPMTLLCQISPTTCDNLKHFRLSSQQRMKMNQDLANIVESQTEDPLGTFVAGAIKACLQDRRRKGDTLFEAIRNCATKGGAIRTLTGEIARKYDLGADLSQVLSLNKETTELVSRMAGKRKVVDGKLKDESGPATLAPEYRALRKQNLKNWDQAIETPEAPHHLSVSPDDLQTLRSAPPIIRRSLLQALASSQAMVDLTRRVHDVERVLDSAMQSPHADGEMRRRLKGTKERLSAELRRLVEERERERVHRTVLSSVLREAALEQQRRIDPVLQRQARERLHRRNRAAERPVSPACPLKSPRGMESGRSTR